MATWVQTKTYVAGDYLSATEMNAAVGNNGDLHWLKNALDSLGVTADSGQQTVDSAFVGCRVFSSGNQEIPDSQWTALTWGQQRWGRHNNVDVSYLSNKFSTLLHLPRVPSAAFEGYWLIGAHIQFTVNTTGLRGIRIVHKPSASNLSSSFVVAAKHKEAVSAAELGMSIVTFDGGNSGTGVGDTQSYVCEVYQDSGTALTVNANGNLSAEMWAVRLASTFAT